MNFHIITLFPEMFDSYLGESILARAQKEKRIKVNFVNPRKFVTGKYRKVWPDGNISAQVDERPYAGGPGMVMMAEPVVKAVEEALKKITNSKLRITNKDSKNQTAKTKQQKPSIKIINFVPSGKKFDTIYAKNSVKKYTDIIMICGRYEGIDARVDKILSKEFGKVDQISIGDYVLTGGEIPAMILIDSISRQVEGVLGNFDSREEERVSSPEIYTRPEVIEYKGKKYKVPKVLLSGDHKKIEDWKRNKK